MHVFLRGFTFIELMVVIGVIAILSAITLATLNYERQHSKDVAIINDLELVRQQAESYFGDNSNYGTQLATGKCDTAGTMFTDSNYPGFARAFNAIKSLNGAPTIGTITYITCNTGPAGYCSAGKCGTYAVGVKLASGSYWCVDSTGVSKSRGSQIGAGTFPC